jgi:hypothetical protein
MQSFYEDLTQNNLKFHQSLLQALVSISKMVLNANENMDS